LFQTVCDQFSKRTVLGDLQVMEAESRHQEKDFCLRSKNLTDEPLIICRQGNNCVFYQGFAKENVRYPVLICRDPISLILGTR